MSALHAALVVTCVGSAAASLACSDETPRMRIVTTQVRAGDRIVVRFEAPPVARWERGERWLTLVPARSNEEFVGERVVIDEGAVETSVGTWEEGTYELRLVEGAPRRPTHVVARLRVEVGRAGLTRDEAPAWYW